jgi:hypothetical protein
MMGKTLFTIKICEKPNPRIPAFTERNMATRIFDSKKKRYNRRREKQKLLKELRESGII